VGAALVLAGVAALGMLGLAVARQQPGGPTVVVRVDGGEAGKPRDKVKIVIQTVPPVKAEIRWGKKKLGLALGKGKAFIYERPRDSGPMDIVITSEGFLPVHTRVHTFNDNKMFIRLTAVTEKHKLFGYRVEVDAGPEGGVPGGADAGAPPMMGPPPPPPVMGPPPPPPQQPLAPAQPPR
jgi:hypothetical protein